MTNNHRTTSRNEAPVWGVAILLLILTGAAMSPSVTGPYTGWDDVDFLNNSDFNTYRGVEALRQTILIGEMAYYPMFRLSLWVDVVAFRLNPMASHCINIALHLANVLLVLWCATIIQRQFKVLSKWGPFAAAALYAVHPLNVEPVGWVCGRKVELAAMFTMLAFIAASRKNYAGAVLAFLIAVLSNLVSLGFPLVLAYWVRVVQKKSVVAATTIVLPFILIAVASTMARTSSKTMENSIAGKDAVQMRIWDFVGSKAEEAVCVVVPVKLACLYPIDKEGKSTDAFIVGVMAAILAITIIVVGRSANGVIGLVAFCLWWYVAFEIPTFGHHITRADRHMYIPMMAVCTILGYLVDKFKLWWAASMVWVVLIVLCAIQASYWGNEVRLFQHTVDVTKDNAIAHTNLGTALIGEGRYAEAAMHFTRSLALRPNRADVESNLGGSLALLGAYNASIAHFKRSLELEPGKKEVEANMGAIQKEMNKLGEH